MIDILEIPIVAINSDQANDFLESLPVESDRSYKGFRHLEFRLTSEKCIYLYLLENFPEKDNYYIWDRIIPKAPFCLFLFNWEDPAFADFYDYYKKRYETPLLFAAPKLEEEADLSDIEDEILKNENNRIIFYEGQDENSVKSAIKQALQFVLDNTIVEENEIAMQID